MKETSKQRPSSFIVQGAKERPDDPWRHPAPVARPLRLFHNTYSRGGKRYVVKGWSVKIQHEGSRRTYSLRGKTKREAATEAMAIRDAVAGHGPGPHAALLPVLGTGEPYPRTDARYWRPRLLLRRFRFVPAGAPEKYYAAHIDFAGTGCFFPLGATEAAAAARAVVIHRALADRGWNTVCRKFSRELAVAFAWCANPVLWTYTTLHTMVSPARPAPPRPGAEARRVLIVEPDAAIRRALEWCVDQQAGLRSAACGSEKSFKRSFETQQPSLVLVNQNIAGRIGLKSHGQVGPFWNGVPALAYWCAADADGLFTAPAPGADGYLFMRVKPERLLEPVPLLNGNSLTADDILARVRAHYKTLLQPRTGRDSSALSKLTPREHHVLTLLSEGRVDKEIAAALGISVWTVHGHIKSIFARLRVRTRTEAAVRYLEE